MSNRNLIIQHWEGPMDDALKECQQSVIDYAKRIGVEYIHVPGKPFSEELGYTAQKMHVLDEKWDEYDRVLMLDMDIWIKPDAFNCFEHPGNMIWDVGRPVTWSKWGREGDHCKRDAPYPMGPYYMLSREERQMLRQHINMPLFIERCNVHPGDEVIMHHLMWKAEWIPVDLPEHYCDAAERSTDFFHFCGPKRTRAMAKGLKLLRNGIRPRDRYMNY